MRFDRRACPPVLPHWPRLGAGPADVPDGILVERAARRRRGNRPTTPMSAAVPSATTADHGTGTSRLANGSPAATSTSAIIRRRPTHAGSAMAAPSPAGMPAPTSRPAPIATMPAAMTGATSGTTTRLIAGATMARRPNAATTIGKVASCAARETPRLSASQAGARPPVQRSDPLGRARAPGDEPGRGQRRQLEARVADETRVRHQQPDRGPAQRCGRPARPTGLPREEDDGRHEPGAQDGRRRTGERDVGRDRGDA